VTRYRAALPDHAGPAANHNSPPGDAQAAGLAEVLGPDAGRLIGASPYREPASLATLISDTLVRLATASPTARAAPPA
jgi:hypothetical protein